MLRKILLDTIPTDCIKWRHELTSVHELGNRECEITFANSTTATVDILVRAPTRASILLSPVQMTDCISPHPAIALGLNCLAMLCG